MKILKYMRCFRHHYILLAIILHLMILVYLLISPPHMTQIRCPTIVYIPPDTALKQPDNQPETSNKHPVINCNKIIAGDKQAVQLAERYVWCHQPNRIILHQYVELLSNCSLFKSRFGYENHTVSSQELAFPIAFSILVHDDVIQLEHLLRAIYRSHNYYSIHVDKKSSDSTKSTINLLVQCFANIVLVSDPVSVHWAEYSVLQAEIANMKQLWKWTHWKYLLNLAGSEFPLRTNKELVEILTVYNGANDIDGSPYGRNHEWTDYIWYTENWRTKTKKLPPPHKFVINKGSTHIAASREFIGYVLTDQRSQDLLDWMRDIRAPDEHFFATLNHNPTKDVPGAYTEIPTSKTFLTRFKIWQTTDGREVCHGRWVRHVCNLGAGDLHRVVSSMALFANKFNMKRDYIGFRCIEQWHKSRTMYGVSNKFNITYYKQQPWVTHHT